MTSELDQKVYNEICDKLQIAKHVITMTETAPPQFLNNQFVRTICHYTGVDRKSVDELVIFGKARKTFLDLFAIRNNKHDSSVISFEQMRNIIFDHYVINHQIPTKSSIVKAVKATEKVSKLYTPFIVTQDLNNLGFIWKRLPKSNRYIVVENTEQFSNRMKYFQQMQEYRDNNRVLIHVERMPPCVYYENLGRVNTTEVIVVASPQLGLINTCFPPNLKPLEFFLRNKLHTVPDNSVFVIEQSNPSGVDLKHTCELPTVHSQKKDMMKWLDTYNIPYDSTLHRGELFALIEKHRVNCPPYYKCCEILKAAGHDVILRPPELTYIKYFKEMKSRTLPMLKMHLLNKLNNIPEGHWLEEDQKMAAAEQKIYDEDQKLELILDKLMEGIKNNNLNVSDFKECEEEEIDAEFVDSVIVGAYPNAFIPGSIKPFKSLAFKPGPSSSSKPGPSCSSKPGPSGSSKPAPSGSSKPAPSGSSKSGPSGSSKPGLSGSSKPGPSGLSKPKPFGSSKPQPSQAQAGPSRFLE